MTVLTERVLRQMVATALNAVTSRAELESLAREFDQGTLSLDIARALRSVAGALPSPPYAPKGSSGSRLEEDELVDFIQRRKISKPTARLIMIEDVPAIKGRLADAKQTVRSYVRQYLSAGGSVNSFLDRYQRGPGAPDPYLEGIVQRVTRS